MRFRRVTVFFFLVLRDIKVLYKQTVLGFAWAIIRPVFSMIVFSLVFGKLAEVPRDGVPYPIFSLISLIPSTTSFFRLKRITRLPASMRACRSPMA